MKIKRPVIGYKSIAQKEFEKGKIAKHKMTKEIPIKHTKNDTTSLLLKVFFSGKKYTTKLNEILFLK